MGNSSTRNLIPLWTFDGLVDGLYLTDIIILFHLHLRCPAVSYLSTTHTVLYCTILILTCTIHIVHTCVSTRCPRMSRPPFDQHHPFAQHINLLHILYCTANPSHLSSWNTAWYYTHSSHRRSSHNERSSLHKLGLCAMLLLPQPRHSSNLISRS